MSTTEDTGGEGRLADLNNMERVVEIFELLGGNEEPQIAHLVTPYREWLRTDDVMLCEAPFSASRKILHRVFLFRDLLVIGRQNWPNQAQSKKQQLKGPNVLVGSEKDPHVTIGGKLRSVLLPFPGRKSANGSEWSSTLRVPDKSSKVKLTHYLPLSQCSLKTVRSTSDDQHGIQVTYICRVRVQKEDKDQVVTRVEKLEFWFPACEQRDDFVRETQRAMDDEEELARQSDQGAEQAIALSTTSADPPTGARSWAKARPKAALVRTSESADVIRTRKGSGDSEETFTTTQKEGISLEDLAKRYNVDFGLEPSLENIAKFSIEFGEGQMGFSLSSGDGVGVIIGRLTPQSFADLGGCEVGDRLESVNGVEIGTDMTWQRAVEVITAGGRPVTLGFVRNIQLQAKIREFEEAAAPESGGPGTNRRRWRAGEARLHGGHNGLISLEDLEKMYHGPGKMYNEPEKRSSASSGEDDGSVDDNDAVVTQKPSIIHPPTDGKAVLEAFAATCVIKEERVCVTVLTEILETEKAYVSESRLLIKEYLLPLRRAQKRRKCQDLDSANLMCEHGSVRSSCQKKSSEAGPLVSPDDLKTIFMNVETLVKVNAELLKALQSGLRTFQESGITDVSEGLTYLVDEFASSFEKITPFFTMYALYCHQYPSAAERLQKLRVGDTEADDFIREREARSGSILRFLLIKPVQRICRYPLLFRELLRRVTAVQHVYPDRKKGNFYLTVEVMRNTANIVERIAKDVNEKVGGQETIGSIMNVFHELGGSAKNGDERIRDELLVPSRRFVRAEEVHFKEALSDGEMQPRRLYLFNDLIILAVERAVIGGGVKKGGTLTRASVNRRSRGRGFVDDLISFVRKTSRSDRRNDDQVPWTHQATHWIQLQSSEIHPLLTSDDTAAFRLKTIERSTAPIYDELSSAAVRASQTPVPGNLTRVVTRIQKYEIFMAQRDELDSLMRDIDARVSALAVLQQGASKGMAKFGGTMLRHPRRAWIQEEAGTSLGQTPSKSSGESIEARDALNAIAKKYSNVNTGAVLRGEMNGETNGETNESVAYGHEGGSSKPGNPSATDMAMQGERKVGEMDEVFVYDDDSLAKPGNSSDLISMNRNAFTQARGQAKIVIVGSGDGMDDVMQTFCFAAIGEGFGEYTPAIFENYLSDRTIDGRTVEISLWSTAGQTGYDRLRPLSYFQTDIFILLFSFDDLSSIQRLETVFVPEIGQHAPGAYKVMVGAHAERRLKQSNLPWFSKLQKHASELGCGAYYEWWMPTRLDVYDILDQSLRGWLASQGQRENAVKLPAHPKIKRGLLGAPKLSKTEAPTSFDNDAGSLMASKTLGIHLGHINSLVNQHDARGMTITEFCNMVVKPLTKDKSYAHFLLSDPHSIHNVKAQADSFVSYAWSYRVGEVLDALLKDSDSGRPEDNMDRFIWMDVFVVSQHSSGSVQREEWMSTFSQAIIEIGRCEMVLIPWHNPVTTSRTWCVFEQYEVAKRGIQRIARMTSTDESQAQDAFKAGLSLGSIKQMFSSIEVEASQTTDPLDREAIIGLIRKDGVDIVNNVTMRVLRTWLLSIGQLLEESNQMTPGSLLTLKNLRVFEDIRDWRKYEG